jgi:hypothetical protein
MGHSTTEMLFRVYSRFVPNLTRQDGSAFERLLLQSGTAQPQVEEPGKTVATNEQKQNQNNLEAISHE